MFEKSTVRKYGCFVCGREYGNQDEFRQHIIDSHEEGREYLICPLAHCGVPVRDMKLHFKTKHLENPLPPGCQEKVMIWKDFSTNDKKAKTRKPTFRKGSFISLKNNGKEVKYRSGFECSVFEALESIDKIEKYDVEPLSIDYLFEGQMHKYFPDLSIKFIDGKIEIWEIKPQNQTSLPVNEAKWAAAENYCAARGWKFVVITEQGLEKLKKINNRS